MPYPEDTPDSRFADRPEGQQQAIGDIALKIAMIAGSDNITRGLPPDMEAAVRTSLARRFDTDKRLAIYATDIILDKYDPLPDGEKWIDAIEEDARRVAPEMFEGAQDTALRS